MTAADLSNTLEKFMKHIILETVECNEPSKCDDVYGHLIQCVYTLKLTYKPTGNCLTVVYEKSPFEPTEVMKYAVLSALRNELRDYNCGGWRRLVDDHGMYYVNSELRNGGVTEETKEAWQKHKIDVKSLFLEEYDNFVRSF